MTYQAISDYCIEHEVTLVAVSKTKPESAITELYDRGQRHFGENRVQELVKKQENLPKDIKWHMIGHLQTNKVKYIAPFVHLIHAVDSITLLDRINRYAIQNNRKISVLLQLKIAQEESKYGLTKEGLEVLTEQLVDGVFPHVDMKGLMGMATFTDDVEQVRGEFDKLTKMRDTLIKRFDIDLPILSMGMSGDYQTAIAAGSTMVRIGSLLFGSRD